MAYKGTHFRQSSMLCFSVVVSGFFIGIRKIPTTSGWFDTLATAHLVYLLLYCQTTEPLPDDDDSFELPEEIQPFMQDTPLYTDNTANGESS